MGKVKKTSGTVEFKLSDSEGKSRTHDDISLIRPLVGYVPQDDIMLRELSIREILMHSARMRLPREWKYPQVRMKVLQILSVLRLDHIQASPIGDSENRGISGGQR